MAFGLMPFDPLREIDRLERMMRRSFEGPGRGVETIGTPAVEVSDEGDHYLVRCEIPGVPEEGVEITLSGNVLSLRGEKRVEKKGKTLEAQAGGKPEEKKAEGEAGGKPEEREAKAPEEAGRSLYSEVYYGRFERILTLPDDIDPEKIEAHAKHGVYSIEIGKKQEQRPKKISVTRH